MNATLGAVPEGYRTHDEASLIDYIGDVPSVAALLGGAAADWRIKEVGDGNLNFVFILQGPEAGVVVKQALPYVRLVGESWPLPLSRAHFEHLALVEQGRHAPSMVPTVYHYDERLALIVMEFFAPHIIMRRGMIDAIRYPRFSDDMTTFLARTLFFTSDLALAAADKKSRMAVFCANDALSKITEDLVFTEPYLVHDNNRWTAPQLDGEARAIREDGPLKVAVSELKLKFLSDAQALIHGDLHTGSIMVTEDQTKVIDPEFAYFGPMGFDVGALIANLLLNYFSQDGHATAAAPRAAYQDWVLDQVSAVWTGFDTKFRALWNTHRTGDAYPAPLFDGDARAFSSAQDLYMARLFGDTLGFAAAKMIRRILGLAHNIDLEWIEDAEMRAKCERRALRLAREMMIERHRISSIGDVVAAARAMRSKIA